MAFLLAMVLLLCSCGPAVETEGSEKSESATDVQSESETETETETVAAKKDFKIKAQDDAYVLNKNGEGSQMDTNFGTETEIHLKTNGSSLTRYGYLKFDISALAADTAAQIPAGPPHATTTSTFSITSILLLSEYISLLLI